MSNNNTNTIDINIILSVDTQIAVSNSLNKHI